MTSLKDRLSEDLRTAMKARDELRAATLRMLLTAVRTAEVAGESARTLDDGEVLDVLAKEVKKRREAADAFEAAGRRESTDRERAEAAVIESYLPTALSEDELAALVAAALTETGATGPAAMGPVMRAVTPKVARRADGGRVAAEVRRQLGGASPN